MEAPLEGFQADLTFILSASFAHPGHPTKVGAGHVFTEYKFDYLTTTKLETSAYPKAFQRKIEDVAAESLWLAVQVDPQTGASFQHHTLRAASFGNRRVVHSFSPVSPAWPIRQFWRGTAARRQMLRG